MTLKRTAWDYLSLEAQMHLGKVETDDDSCPDCGEVFFYEGDKASHYLVTDRDTPAEFGVCPNTVRGQKLTEWFISRERVVEHGGRR